jgi:CheY-like chemotaxis protein/HPt (histidine-containing phosphotransfer) domain-containing protein
VVIGRGPRRHPHQQETDLVTIDGDVLCRRTLAQAVALAAGRVRETEETLQPGRKEAEFRPVSRDEALRQGRLILLAEDNETNQKVILRQFALLGYAGDVAEDGVQALQHWRRGDYALLLTDLHMPEMDGYQLTAAIPIIALTANALRSEAERCLAAGMDGYLSKPAQLVDLKTTLETWLPASGPVAAAAPSVNVKTLQSLVGDDPEIIQALLQDFRTSAAKMAVALRTACQTGEAMAAGNLAHKLKSAARSVGALALGEVCTEIEQAGMAGRSDALTTLLLRFETEMAKVEDDLDATRPIDLDALAAILGTDKPEIVNNILREFLEAASASWAQVAAAVTSGRPDEIRAASHGAGGEARSVAASGLADHYAALERQAEDGDPAMSQELVALSLAELRRIDDFVHEGPRNS